MCLIINVIIFYKALQHGKACCVLQMETIAYIWIILFFASVSVLENT